MKLDLHSELEHSKQKEKIVLDKVAESSNEVKLLLDIEASEDQRILNAISPNSAGKLILEKKGKQLELEKLEDQYGSIYTEDQIKQLCVKYRLRFLKSKYYIGNMDVGILSALKSFSKQSGLELNDATIESYCYIMAPAECFNLEKRKIVWEKDPVMFWKIGGSDSYRLIKKWGKDFTIFRALLGFKYKSSRHFWWFEYLTSLPIITFLIYLCFPVYLLMLPSLSFLVLPIATLLANWGITAIRYEVCREKLRYKGAGYQTNLISENNWNQTFIYELPWFI